MSRSTRPPPASKERANRCRPRGRASARLFWRRRNSDILSETTLDAFDCCGSSVMIPFCPIQLRWLTAEEGGRASPVQGDRYTPTARFAGEQEQFSVDLGFPGNRAVNPTKGTL